MDPPSSNSLSNILSCESKAHDSLTRKYIALNVDTAPLSNTKVTIEVYPPLLGMGDIGVDMRRGVRSFGVGGTEKASLPPEWTFVCVWVVHGPNSTLNLTCFWMTAPVI